MKWYGPYEAVELIAKGSNVRIDDVKGEVALFRGGRIQSAGQAEEKILPGDLVYVNDDGLVRSSSRLPGVRIDDPKPQPVEASTHPVNRLFSHVD